MEKTENDGSDVVEAMKNAGVTVQRALNWPYRQCQIMNQALNKMDVLPPPYSSKDTCSSMKDAGDTGSETSSQMERNAMPPKPRRVAKVFPATARVCRSGLGVSLAMGETKDMPQVLRVSQFM